MDEKYRVDSRVSARRREGICSCTAAGTVVANSTALGLSSQPVRLITRLFPLQGLGTARILNTKVWRTHNEPVAVTALDVV